MRRDIALAFTRSSPGELDLGRGAGLEEGGAIFFFFLLSSFMFFLTDLFFNKNTHTKNEREEKGSLFSPLAHSRDEILPSIKKSSSKVGEGKADFIFARQLSFFFPFLAFHSFQSFLEVQERRMNWPPHTALTLLFFQRA